MAYSSFFEKQENGVRIVSACWVADKDKEDTPENWNACKFKLEDGSRYVVKKQHLETHKWLWIGD